jgi:hypothetical protein
MASIKDESLTALLNTTIFIRNPEESDGLHVSANLPVGENHAVHSLQAVDIYCDGPDQLKIQCSRVMDNTELFFIMADALGLGNNDDIDSVTESLNLLSSSSNTISTFGVLMMLLASMYVLY